MPVYKDSLAVLIPVFEEDYALTLAVGAIAPHADEIWIHDDGSGPDTARAIDYLRARFANLRASGTIENRGRTSSITSLLARCKARHIIVLDADCVFYEDKLNDLREMVSGDCPSAILGFAECWGDFWHSRRSLPVSWDSLCYVDRAVSDYAARQLGPPTYYHENVFSRTPREWPGALFFHMAGVRDDRRLALRSMRRSIHEAGRPTDIMRWEKFAHLSDEEIHRRAMRFLFHDALVEGVLCEFPATKVPSICRENDRFELVFDEQGKPRDRIDRGWETPD